MGEKKIDMTKFCDVKHYKFFNTYYTQQQGIPNIIIVEYYKANIKKGVLFQDFLENYHSELVNILKGYFSLSPKEIEKAIVDYNVDPEHINFINKIDVFNGNDYRNLKESPFLKKERFLSCRSFKIYKMLNTIVK
jgi:hypothetical protein